MKLILVNGQPFTVDDAGNMTPASVTETTTKGKGKGTKAIAAVIFTPTLESFPTADGTRYTLRLWPYKGMRGGSISPAEAEALLKVGDAEALALLKATAAKKAAPKA